MRVLSLNEMQAVVGGQSNGSIPPGYTAVGDGQHYMQDSQGNYHLTPSYQDSLQNAQANGWGIDWTGVAIDLVTISGGSIGGAGGGGIRFLGGWIGQMASAAGELRDALSDALLNTKNRDFERHEEN